MKNILTTMTIILFALILSIFLQVYLSKQKSKYFGLILPLISFVFSLIVLANYVVPNGLKIGPFLMSVLGIFLFANTFTLIYLVIYFTFKHKKNSSSEIDKMNIKDL